MAAMVRFSAAHVIISKADVPKAVCGQGSMPALHSPAPEIYAAPNTALIQAWLVFMHKRRLFLRVQHRGHQVW